MGDIRQCYNCFEDVTLRFADMGAHIINALVERLDEDFVEAMTDESLVSTVHCVTTEKQQTSTGDVVYCPRCTLQLISDGLRLPS